MYTNLYTEVKPQEFQSSDVKDLSWQYNNEYQSHTVRKSTIMEKMKERVKSKNLFNFKPQGRLDEDIEAFYEKGKVGFTNNSLAAWSDSLKKMSEEEFVRMMRQMMDKNLATSSMVIDPALVEVRYDSPPKI